VHILTAPPNHLIDAGEPTLAARDEILALSTHRLSPAAERPRHA